MTELSPAVRDYRARLDSAMRRPLEGGLAVRCKCGNTVGRIVRYPEEGLFLRTYAHDVAARMAERAMKEDLGLDAMTLSTSVWLVNFPEAVTGPIRVECSSCGALRFDRARCTTAVKAGKDLYLPPIHHQQRR